MFSSVMHEARVKVVCSWLFLIASESTTLESRKSVTKSVTDFYVQKKWLSSYA
jgi:hypothetical protein